MESLNNPLGGAIFLGGGGVDFLDPIGGLGRYVFSSILVLLHLTLTGKEGCTGNGTLNTFGV